MANNKAQSSWSTSTKRLAVLSILYFIIELVLNYSIYNQLSLYSSAIAINVLEFWGKMITGLGLALIITRVFFARSEPTANRVTVFHFFIMISVACIPASFYLQNLLINYVVDSSDDEQRNKAILVAATHNTLVPFYDTTHKSKEIVLNPIEKTLYPFLISPGFLPTYWDKERLEMMGYSKSCVEASEDALEVRQGIDKTFFSYYSYQKDIDESFYKNVIKNYHLCLYSKDRHFKSRTFNTLNQKTLIYSAFTTEYLPASKEYRYYAEKNKQAADKEWRKRINEFLGFKSTLAPGLSMSEFFNHRDIKRYYAEQTGLEDLHPTDDKFEEKMLKRIKSNLPDAAIPAYINVTGKQSDISKQMTEPERLEQARTAYKAIVMPVIALGMSAFFLILNAILFLYSIVTRAASKQVALLFLWVAVVWFLLYPNVKSSELLDELDRSGHKPVAKWIYYHENKLSKVYELIIPIFKIPDEDLVSVKLIHREDRIFYKKYNDS